MLKLGLKPLLAILVFGIAVPFALHKAALRIGAPLLILLAAALGLGYGALKADNAWNGQGLMDNLRLMAICAMVAAAYVGLSLGAAKALAHIRF